MRLPAFRFDWRWRLDATPDALWPLVSDTDRFNRDTGLPPVELLGEGPSATRRLRFRRLGVVVEWEEQPFEWLTPRRFGVVRRYSRGPIAEMRVRVLLDPDGTDGTRLRYVTVVRPRGLFGALATWIQVGLLSRRAFERVYRRYAAIARLPAPRRLDAGAASVALAPGARRRLERSAAALVGAGHGAPVVRRLTDLLERGDDMTVARLRPYAIADAWSEPRARVLELFMSATRGGLLDLRWDLLCPLCRGSAQSAGSLDELRREVHCDTCNIHFAAEFDRAVELSFQPNAVIRSADTPPFCVAGPQVTPHVSTQRLVHARARAPIEVPHERGRYRVRALGVPDACHIDVAPDGAASAHARVDERGWAPARITLAPGARLQVENDSAVSRLVMLERTAWADDAVTAAEVTALQVFRDLFSSEVLAAGDFRSVGRLAVLFTDLRDSTALYRRIGDAPAYGLVQRHFDLLHDLVKRHDGAIVKTIGDSVMAVFQRPVSALSAIVAAQDALAADAASAGLVLKAGVHYGPCIAVNVDGRLDYFGSTVNIAARLDKLSEGDDVVFSDSVRRDPEVEALLEGGRLSALPFEGSIRGAEDLDVELWRVRRG